MGFMHNYGFSSLKGIRMTNFQKMSSQILSHVYSLSFGWYGESVKLFCKFHSWKMLCYFFRVSRSRALGSEQAQLTVRMIAKKLKSQNDRNWWFLFVIYSLYVGSFVWFSLFWGVYWWAEVCWRSQPCVRPRKPRARPCWCVCLILFSVQFSSGRKDGFYAYGFSSLKGIRMTNFQKMSSQILSHVYSLSFGWYVEAIFEVSLVKNALLFFSSVTKSCGGIWNKPNSRFVW